MFERQCTGGKSMTPLAGSWLGQILGCRWWRWSGVCINMTASDKTDRVGRLIIAPTTTSNSFIDKESMCIPFILFSTCEHYSTAGLDLVRCDRMHCRKVKQVDIERVWQVEEQSGTVFSFQLNVNTPWPQLSIMPWLLQGEAGLGARRLETSFRIKVIGLFFCNVITY